MHQISILVFIHLAVIFPCLIIGTYLMVAQKGTKSHQLLGKFYLVMMGFTGLLTLFMPAQVGPTLWNHFGLLHLLSILTIWSVPRAWIAIKNGQVEVHKTAMTRLYVGGLLLAGSFAVFAEGRYLNKLIFH